MAYSRRAPKQDIRSIRFQSGSASQPESPLAVETKPQTSAIVIQHNPGLELRQIAFISVPLLLALGIATYLDTTKHWVIPLAQRLFHIG